MEKTIVGNCTFYLGDAREILPTLGYCADCIVSDPPNPRQDENSPSWEEIMNLYYNSMRVGHCYIIVNDKNLRDMLNAAEQVGFKFNNMLVINKGFSPPVIEGYSNNLNFVAMFFKGPNKYIENVGDEPLDSFDWVQETDHPDEKPVSIMEKYIRNSTEGGDKNTVLDPFFGSGSTAIACMNSRNKFIGIESDRKWYDIAIARARETLQLQEDWQNGIRSNYDRN